MILQALVVVIWLYGLWSLGKLAYVKAVPLRHRAVNHRAIGQAAVLADNERLLREQEHELWPDKKHEHLDCTICGPGPLLQGVVPSRYEHPFFTKKMRTMNDGYGTWKVEVLKAARPEYATMVASKILHQGKYTGRHTLMLDIDLPATLVESTTTGHYHLYIDHPMTWRRYRNVLKAMDNAGLIEDGYYRAAIRQGSTMLRPPWVKKPFDPPDMQPRKSSGKRWDHRWNKSTNK